MIERYSQWGIDGAMERLERYMRGLVTSPVFLLSRPSRHILSAGGKRLRAALTFLSTQLDGAAVSDAAVYGAAAVELIHAASLVHDDLIDHAAQRRGRPTIHEKWHHATALLSGDYLFALAARSIAMTDDIRVLECLAEASVAICEGETRVVDQVEPLEEALEHYTFHIGRKTASLFQAAGQVGGLCGGASEEMVRALGRYGHALGMAFQIVDDVLDYVADEEILGKPVGGDLRRGVITLPLIYAVAYDDDGFLREVVDRSDDSLRPEEIAEAVRRIQSSSGPGRAREDAEWHRREALRCLDALNGYPGCPALAEVADLVVERSF